MPSGSCCVDCCDRKIEKVIVDIEYINLDGTPGISTRHEEIIGKSLREMNCHYFFKIGAPGGFLTYTALLPGNSNCQQVSRPLTDLSIKFKFTPADPSASPPVPMTAKFIEFASNKLLSTTELISKSTCTITRNDDLTEQEFYWSDERFFGQTKLLVNYSTVATIDPRPSSSSGCTLTDAEIRTRLLTALSFSGIADVVISRVVLPTSNQLISGVQQGTCSQFSCKLKNPLPTWNNGTLASLYETVSMDTSREFTDFHLLIGLSPSSLSDLNHGANSISLSVSANRLNKYERDELVSYDGNGGYGYGSYPPSGICHYQKVKVANEIPTITAFSPSVVPVNANYSSVLSSNCCLRDPILGKRTPSTNDNNSPSFPSYRILPYVGGDTNYQCKQSIGFVETFCSERVISSGVEISTNPQEIYDSSVGVISGLSSNLGYTIQIIYDANSKASNCCKNPNCPNRVPDDETNDNLDSPLPRVNVESDLKVQLRRLTFTIDAEDYVVDSQADVDHPTKMIPGRNIPSRLNELNRGCVDAKGGTIWTTTVEPGVVKRKAFIIRVGDQKEIEITPLRSVVPGGLPPIMYYNATGGTIIGRVENTRGGDVVTYSLSDDFGGLFAISPDGIISLVGSSRSFLALRGSSVPITVVATNSRSEAETRVIEIQIADATIADSDTAPDQTNEMDIRTFVMPPPATGIDLEIAGESGVVWSMVNNPSNLFQINASSGLVTLRPGSNTALNADAIFGGNPYREILIRGLRADGTEERRRIIVKLNDVDEYDAAIVAGSTTPVFPPTLLGLRLELAQEGAVIFRCRARDEDVTNNRITYTITANPQTLFVVDSETGDVSVSRDITATSTLVTGTCTIRATSQDGSFVSTSVSVSFGVSSVERTELLDEYVLGDETATTSGNVVDENLPPGAEVPIKVRAFNPDFPNRRYTYSFDPAHGGFSDGGRFSIDQKTGQVYAESPLNYERFRSHTIVVVAKADDNVSCTTVVSALGKQDVRRESAVVQTNCNGTGSVTVKQADCSRGWGDWGLGTNNVCDVLTGTYTLVTDNYKFNIQGIVEIQVFDIEVKTRYWNGKLEFQVVPNFSFLSIGAGWFSGKWKMIRDTLNSNCLPDTTQFGGRTVDFDFPRTRQCFISNETVANPTGVYSRSRSVGGIPNITWRPLEDIYTLITGSISVPADANLTANWIGSPNLSLTVSGANNRTCVNGPDLSPPTSTRRFGNCVCTGQTGSPLVVAGSVSIAEIALRDSAWSVRIDKE